MNPPQTPEPLLPNFVSLPLSPDARLEPIVAALRSLPAGRASDYAETRAAAEAPYIDSLDRVRSGGNRVDEVDAAGVPAILVSHPDARGTLIGVHGGSYVLCSARTHLERFSGVGSAARLQTLAVDYRLAPEHPWPAAVDDVVAVMEWAMDNLDGPVALIGDSAGGGLALAAMLRARDLRRLDVEAAVLISPWADLRYANPSHRERRARDPFAHLDDLVGYAGLYIGDGDPDDPFASPIHGNFAGLPPLLIQVGSEETLYDDAALVAQQAAAAGVTVRFETWDGMFHTWHTYVGRLTGADEAIGAAGKFLTDHLAARP